MVQNVLTDVAMMTTFSEDIRVYLPWQQDFQKPVADHIIFDGGSSQKQ
jgi:hypothetical protein